MTRKLYLVLSLSCFLIAGLTYGTGRRQADEALALRLAPSILRFHILANSDSKEDQELKLEVRSYLLHLIQQDFPSPSGKAELCAYLTERKDFLESQAETFMQEKGYAYTAQLDIVSDYFPQKAYGDMVFPCGTYDAVRVTIGNGKGHNWWCVLYPSLCFIDPVSAVVPDSSTEQLESALEHEDYLRLQKPEYKLRPKGRFKLAELFQ